jgi:hypothetical protein
MSSTSYARSNLVNPRMPSRPVLNNYRNHPTSTFNPTENLKWPPIHGERVNLHPFELS